MGSEKRGKRGMPSGYLCRVQGGVQSSVIIIIATFPSQTLGWLWLLWLNKGCWDPETKSFATVLVLTYARTWRITNVTIGFELDRSTDRRSHVTFHSTWIGVVTVIRLTIDWSSWTSCGKMTEFLDDQRSIAVPLTGAKVVINCWVTWMPMGEQRVDFCNVQRCY